jgi:hypothetical protein
MSNKSDVLLLLLLFCIYSKTYLEISKLNVKKKTCYLPHKYICIQVKNKNERSFVIHKYDTDILTK